MESPHWKRLATIPAQLIYCCLTLQCRIWTAGNFAIIAVERPGTKILMMSGALPERLQELMRGLPFLRKPFTPTVLRKSILMALEPKSGMAPQHHGKSQTDQP